MPAFFIRPVRAARRSFPFSFNISFSEARRPRRGKSPRLSGAISGFFRPTRRVGTYRAGQGYVSPCRISTYEVKLKKRSRPGNFGFSLDKTPQLKYNEYINSLWAEGKCPIYGTDKKTFF